MAKGIIGLQKVSGGITKISSADGTGVTELVVPESGELVNKEYADLKVALASFTGTNQYLSGAGYQKFPGGLIIQWGSTQITLNASGSNQYQVVFPTVFPTMCFNVFTEVDTSTPKDVASSSLNINVSGFTSFVSSGITGSTTLRWFAVGY